MAIDNKYGRVILEHGDIGEDEPVFVFRAKDILLPRLLAHYSLLCVVAGSPTQHINCINASIRQICDWQENNKASVPTSDAYYERRGKND